VRNCRTFSGTSVFLSALPDELKNIYLESNILSGVNKTTEESKTKFWKSVEPSTEGD
jgi:hypothetical protein